MISSYGEVKINLLGIFIQCLGIGCEAIRLILVELLLARSGHSMDALTALYHFAPVCTVFCMLATAAFEGPSVFLESTMALGYWTIFLNAVFAFMLNVSAVLLIRKASSLTLTICGVPKAFLTAMLSTQLWGESITMFQLAGFMIASIGLVHYARLDFRNRKKPHPDQATTEGETLL